MDLYDVFKGTCEGWECTKKIAGTVDLYTIDCCHCLQPFCEVRDLVNSMKILLVTFFQMANLLLLLASIVENSLLVQLYVWYMLGFVVMGLLVTLVDFLVRYQQQGVGMSCAIFLPEVAFLFMLSRCLPMVDTYRKHLQGITSISS